MDFREQAFFSLVVCAGRANLMTVMMCVAQGMGVVQTIECPDSEPDQQQQGQLMR
jgi:hypothetical protein